MKRLSIKAAIVGGLLNLLAQFAMPMIAGRVFVGDLLAAMIESAIAIAAGYLAGRIAGRDHVLNGAATSLLCIVLLLLKIVSMLNDPYLEIALYYVLRVPIVVVFVLSPAMGAFGGYLSTFGQVDARAPAE